MLGEGEEWRQPRQADLVDREGAGSWPCKKRGETEKGEGGEG